MHAHDHSHADAGWSAAALDNLQAKGLRNGGARRAVIEHLGDQSCCRSAQEIFDGIRADGGAVGIASVYRALDQLVELELVQRVELGDGIARFEPSHLDGEHHHHLVCDDVREGRAVLRPRPRAGARRRRRAASTTACAPTRSCSTAGATTAARLPDPSASSAPSAGGGAGGSGGASCDGAGDSALELAQEDDEADRRRDDEHHRRAEDLDREDPDDQQHPDDPRAPRDLGPPQVRGEPRRGPRWRGCRGRRATRRPRRGCRRRVQPSLQRRATA